MVVWHIFTISKLDHTGYPVCVGQNSITTIPSAWSCLILFKTLVISIKGGKALSHIFPVECECIYNIRTWVKLPCNYLTNLWFWILAQKNKFRGTKRWLYLVKRTIYQRPFSVHVECLTISSNTLDFMFVNQKTNLFYLSKIVFEINLYLNLQFPKYFVTKQN